MTEVPLPLTYFTHLTMTAQEARKLAVSSSPATSANIRFFLKEIKQAAEDGKDSVSYLKPPGGYLSKEEHAYLTELGYGYDYTPIGTYNLSWGEGVKPGDQETEANYQKRYRA